MQRKGLAHWLLIPSNSNTNDTNTHVDSIKPCRMLGHFIDLNSNETFGLSAQPMAHPPPVHPCCQSKEAPVSFWSVSIFDYRQVQSTVVCEPLLYQGDDCMQLTTDISDWIEVPSTVIKNTKSKQQLVFKTQCIKSNQDAQEHVETYFSTVTFDPDMIICMGEMELFMSLEGVETETVTGIGR